MIDHSYDTGYSVHLISQSRAESSSNRLWRPHLTVFLSSSCIMVLELVAQRVIAPHVGMSLYTWTSIIGVILAGISLGNYLGGRLADRWASSRLLGWIFVLGGLASLAILILDELDLLAPLQWPFVAEILVLITALFFLPATTLGTVSPVVAKLVMRDMDRTGRAAGQIYAAGSAGSIAGTLLTGFFLVSRFSTHVILWGVGGLLLILGLFFLLRRRWGRTFSSDKAPANRISGGMTVKSQPALPRPAWLWRPALIVFLSSACIMVLELAVSQIATSYIGMSLYTWTVIIGVVLAGISLGSYVGGRLADRWTSLHLLGGVLVFGGLASLGLLALNVLEPLTSMSGITREDLPLIVGSAVFGITLCFLACLILGAVSPIVAKLALRDLSRTGRTVGQIYAAGSVGSIIGTFATGFFLISRLGTHTVVWGVGFADSARATFSPGTPLAFDTAVAPSRRHGIGSCCPLGLVGRPMYPRDRLFLHHRPRAGPARRISTCARPGPDDPQLFLAGRSHDVDL
jgi:predicted membrane-bound spermidine synthase